MRRQRTFLGPQAMGGLVSLWGTSSLIRSVQRGTVSFSGTSSTATITSVDMSNSLLFFHGEPVRLTGNSVARTDSRLTFTNATTITAQCGTAPSATKYCSFEVVEFVPGVLKSVQRGTGVTSGSAQTDITITSVNTNKSFLQNLGATYGGAETQQVQVRAHVSVIASATTVGLNANGDTWGLGKTHGFEVAEFF